MSNNSFNDKKGRYEIPTVTLETVDRVVKKYFDEKLNITVDVESGRKKAAIIMATGERWKLTRNNIKDENGAIILPIISIRRINIDRTLGSSFFSQEVSSITIPYKTRTHEKTPNIKSLEYTQKKLGFPAKTYKPVEEFLTIPFPDLCTVYYEIVVWTQYQTQMNEILEKIFYNYDYHDSFAMFTEYDKNKQGKGYRFVGYRDGAVTPESNVEEFSSQERIIRTNYTIKVPAYLILDPKDETLAYGRNRGESPKDKNTKIVYKHQNAIDVRLKEDAVSGDVMEALASPLVEEETKRRFDNILSRGSSGGGARHKSCF